MNKFIGMVQNTNRGRDKSNEDEIKSLIKTIEPMPSSETVEEKLNLLQVWICYGRTMMLSRHLFFGPFEKLHEISKTL